MDFTKFTHFDCVADFVADCLDGKVVNKNNRNKADEFLRYSHAGWFGLSDSTDAKGIAEIVNKGWTTGAKRVSDNAEGIEIPHVPSVRRRRVWGEQGDYVDMDKVRAGQLDTAWQRMAKAASPVPPRVRIICNMVISGGISSEDLFWRGAAALLLADKLAEAGYPVQIISAAAIDCPDKTKIGYGVVVKDWADPMNIPSLAASVALPGFFRSLGHVHLAKHKSRKWDNSFSSPMSAEPFDSAANITFILNPGQCIDREEVIDWINDSIREVLLGDEHSQAA